MKKTRSPIRRRGFTILELLIVIGIILAIGGLVTPFLLNSLKESDTGLTKIQIQNLEQGLDQFYLHMKRYPTEEEGLAALWNSESLEDEEATANWKGPYFEKPSPKDTWGFEWVYRSPSEVEGIAYDLLSVGPDGEEGTDDDLTNLDGRVDADGEPIDGDLSDFTN